LLLPLPAAAASQPLPVGKRPCANGFVSELANALLQSSDPGAPAQLCPALAAVLGGSEAWQGAVAPGGALHALLQEQEGQLCGPPPPRPAQLEGMEEGMEEGDGMEQLGLMNGDQIMALLSRMTQLPA
jgi:hypothetical protein